MIAIWRKRRLGFGSLLFEAIVRLAVGIVAVVSPAATALALIPIFAAWA
jgi:hypothetical protein